MKVILYMAMTINGYIARENDETDFVSDIEWENYINIVSKTKNIIIGEKTYQIMKEGDDFSDLNNPRVIVLTKENREEGNITLTNKSPKEVIDLLKSEGFDTVLIGGGGKLNSSFLKENLVDEIYLDIEPKLIGKGVKLFAENDLDLDLQLLEINKLSGHEVQLHYQVLK